MARTLIEVMKNSLKEDLAGSSLEVYGMVDFRITKVTGEPRRRVIQGNAGHAIFGSIINSSIPPTPANPSEKR